MALTRLQNIISSVEGRILYVNPDDFDATDAIDNKGNSPIRPFKTIARAVLEVAKYSYVSAGNADDKFDQFTILLYPGDHIVDNRPGSYAYDIDGNSNYVGALASVPFSDGPVAGQYGWSDSTKRYADLYKITNSTRGGLIIPRGVSIIGLDLRKTKVRPKYIPAGGSNTVAGTTQINYTASNTNPNELVITGVSNGPDAVNNINDVIIGSTFKAGVTGFSILSQFTPTAATYDPITGQLELTIGTHTLTTDDSIRIATNSLTFTCASDGNSAQVSYPRTSDPAYDANLGILATTSTTITVNVGPSSETSAHTFISATANAVTAINISLKIEQGTTITDISCNTGANTITVGISKPHNYSATDVSNNTNVGTGELLTLPYEDDNSRTALFKITGGCYFWQFSIFDGDPTGVYRSTTTKPAAAWTVNTNVEFSHTKLTVFEFASLHDLHTFYRKVSDVVSLIACEKIETKIQENRIVGALADAVRIQKVTRNNNLVTVTLTEELDLTAGNFVSITGQGDDFITESSDSTAYYIGQRKVSGVISRSEFTFVLTSSAVTALDGLETDADGATGGTQISYEVGGNPGIDTSAQVEVEIDTVESASPYIFNVSLRSTYGICGMHADGSRATGFKSMVVAQYTGISLQKDDSAFLKYNDGSGIYQTESGSLHTDINAIYNPLQRSYHVKASNRAVIQAVSVFAVGYADHFIAEDGGDMSITNSNSNFGMNAMRSIGYSDVAFNKDSLGKITHIIPPRNVESNPSNTYYEALDAVKTATSNLRVYLSERDDLLSIGSGGSNFISGNVSVTDPNGSSKTVTLTATNGVVTAATFVSNDYGAFQPGDVITIPTNATNGIGLDCELRIGAGLDAKVGKFFVGEKYLAKDGTAEADKIFVPLYASSSATNTTEQSSTITKDGTTGNVFEFDFGATGGWYIRVSSSNNGIYNAIDGNSKYGAATISTTPTSYIKRINDERVADDKIYRLRYVTTSKDGNLPSYPQTGYVLQPKKGAEIDGVGDRFTDGANLLLLNKYFLAYETVSRYLNANPSFVVPNGNQRCVDDLINIIESVAYNLRYGGNDEVYNAASKYISGGSAYAALTGERDETVVMLNTYLKPMMQYVINNGVTGSPVNTPALGTIRNGNYTWTDFTSQINPTLITGEEQLINVFGGCTNVRDAAFTLIDIVVQAVGSDATPGNLTGVTETTPTATYTRINGQEYNDVYYVYEVEEVTKYQAATGTTSEVPGVYYLTVLKGSIPVSDTVLPGNTFKFSQNTDHLYPDIDLDNIVNDPLIAQSIANPLVIGDVDTTTGLDAAVTTEDLSFSITKESLSYYLDEYLNNELEWLWNGVTSTSRAYHRVNQNLSNGTHNLLEVDLESGIGSGEIRKIPINPTRAADGIEIELRRPSTIRSGNHTFEYVGFGPGNYSTGFPIRQSKILSNDEIKYSQSLKEQGGIAFYSGLNSNGDLFIGNTVINAVTGKTTSNEITELNTLTLKENLNVLGGSGNTIASSFQGPVNFLNRTTFDTEDNFFTGIKLRNPDGIVSKFINRDATTGVTDPGVGDFIFDTVPSNEGGMLGWSYTENNEWRKTGIIGTEKIHAYRNGTGGTAKYVLNVGQDEVTLSSNTVNYNFDLDVVNDQRIGNNLDIGVAANPTTLSSTTSSKSTRLYIEHTWDNSAIEYKPLEIKIAGSPTNADASRIINAEVGSTSVFNVDKDGNVTIPDTSTYGLSRKAFALTVTIANTPSIANSQDSMTLLDGQGGNPSPLTVDVIPYTGGVAGTSVARTFGARMTTALGSFRYYGADSSVSARTADHGGIGNLADFNTRSMVVYVNGIIQSPYFNYHFDGTYLYFDNTIASGSRIDIRCLAN